MHRHRSRMRFLSGLITLLSAAGVCLSLFVPLVWRPIPLSQTSYVAEAVNREGIQAVECGNLLLLLCLQGWQGLALERMVEK